MMSLVEFLCIIATALTNSLQNTQFARSRVQDANLVDNTIVCQRTTT
jgi:hypothetical protein